MTDYDELNISPEVIAIISEAAARKASEVTIKTYTQLEQRNSPFKRKTRQAKRILENYRDLKILAKKNRIRPTEEEIEEFSFKYTVAMMEGRESKVDKIVEEEMNSNIRTYIQLRKINEALKSFKQSCSNSKSEERQRQYRALEHRYILDDKKTVEEIAEMEHVSTTTVTRDINIAIARFTFFLRPDLEFFD